MDRLLWIFDDIDDALCLLLRGLGRPGTAAVCVCIGLVTGAAIIAGWRGMMLSLIASGPIVALLALVSRDRG